MNTLEALAVLAGVGIAGYIGYEYVSKGASTSTTTTTGATPSYVPIGQATPYETTGHLEDPLINELLNAVNSLKQQITSLTSPTIFSTYPTTTAVSVSPPPITTPTTTAVSVSPPPITTSTISPTNPPTPTHFGGTCSGGNCPAPPPPMPKYPKPEHQTIKPNKRVTKWWISPIPKYKNIKKQKIPTLPPIKEFISKEIQTGTEVNTQQAKQIQIYNPYYQPGTPTTATSKIGALITGTMVNLLGGPSSQAAQTYLNVTRPFVTTAEAALHPEIKAFNQAVSSVEKTASNVESSVASKISNAQKTAQNVMNEVSSAASNAEKAIGNWFSHL